MSSYLLDTSVIIDYLRGKKATVNLVKDLFYKGSNLGCCAINIAETYAGMLEKERGATEQFIDGLEYYEISRSIAKRAGDYKRQYAQKGVGLSVPDVTIAAVAVDYELTLITGNSKHYPMPELKMIAHLAK